MRPLGLWPALPLAGILQARTLEGLAIPSSKCCAACPPGGFAGSSPSPHCTAPFLVAGRRLVRADHCTHAVGPGPLLVQRSGSFQAADQHQQLPQRHHNGEAVLQGRRRHAGRRFSVRTAGALDACETAPGCVPLVAVECCSLYPGETERGFFSHSIVGCWAQLDTWYPTRGSHVALVSQDSWTSRWLLTHVSCPQPGCRDSGRPTHVSREGGQSGISRGTLLTLQGAGTAAGLYGPASEVPSIASAVFLGLYRAGPRSPREGTSSL